MSNIQNWKQLANDRNMSKDAIRLRITECLKFYQNLHKTDLTEYDLSIKVRDYFEERYNFNQFTSDYAAINFVYARDLHEIMESIRSELIKCNSKVCYKLLKELKQSNRLCNESSNVNDILSIYLETVDGLYLDIFEVNIFNKLKKEWTTEMAADLNDSEIKVTEEDQEHIYFNDQNISNSH